MKLITRRLLVEIPSGQNEVEKNIKVPSGQRIVVLASTTMARSGNLASLAVDESGNEIHPFQDVHDFNSQIGSPIQRGIELKTNSGGDWTVKVQTVKDVTQNEWVEVKFLVQQDTDESCS